MEVQERRKETYMARDILLSPRRLFDDGFLILMIATLITQNHPCFHLMQRLCYLKDRMRGMLDHNVIDRVNAIQRIEF